MRQTFLIALLLITSAANASSMHMSHEKAVKLISWSAFNFTILVIAFIYLFKNKLIESFNNKREEIQAIYTQSLEKKREAEKARENYQARLSNLTSFEDGVMKETISNTVKFKDHYKEEIDQKIERVKKDSLAKIEATKKLGEERIRQELMDSLIADTKSTLNANPELKGKVTKKILQSI